MSNQPRAPIGGTRIAGKFYRGGQMIPIQYHRGEGGMVTNPDMVNQRLSDPAAGIPDMPPNFGRQILPHVASFVGVQSSYAKAYRYSDEAMKHSVQNAHMMLNDPAVMEPLLTRILHTVTLNWHVKPEDSEDKLQVQVANDLEMLINRIPYFSQYRVALLMSIWYGRYAIENQFEAFQKNGRRWYGVRDWLPVDGDKLVYRFDDGTGQYQQGQMGIRMSPTVARLDKIAGAHQLEPTYDGLVYFLKDWERKHYTTQRFLRLDGVFERPLDAGNVNGVGLRNFLYWVWYQKQETLAQLMEIVERTAQGWMIYRFPEGNKQARDEMEETAKQQAHTNIILLPVSADGTESFGVEVIPANTGGIDTLRDLMEDTFNHAIKRLILGQILSSEADSTGLGSGVASFQKASLGNIIKFDAANHGEALTRELLKTLIDFNHPSEDFNSYRFVVDTESADPNKDLQALRTAWEMGVQFRERDIHDTLGTTPPKKGEKKTFNPVIAQQIRLAKQEEESADGESEVADLLGEYIGANDDVDAEMEEIDQGEDLTNVSQQAAAKHLAQRFYGDYWVNELGGNGEEEAEPEMADAGSQQFTRGGQPIQYEGMTDSSGSLHAPAGGITIHGEFFQGGQFITKGDLDQASPAELSALRMQFAGDPGALKTIEEALGGGQSSDPADPLAQRADALAAEWGKALQVNTAGFLLRQVTALKNAGFDVDITGDTRDEQVRQAIQQLEAATPLMHEFIDTAREMGIRESKAQGLVTRVNYAASQIMKKAEETGYHGKGGFQERFSGAMDHLIAAGEVDQTDAMLRSDVAMAALKLASKVFGVPLAQKLGYLFAVPGNEYAESVEFLKGLRNNFKNINLPKPEEFVEAEAVEDEVFDAEIVEGQDDKQPKEPTSEPDAENPEEIPPPPQPKKWDDIQDYDAKLHTAMAQALGFRDLTPAEYEAFQPIAKEAHEVALQTFRQDDGRLVEVLGADAIRQYGAEARKILRRKKNPGDHAESRGFDILVDRVRREAPNALQIAAGEDDSSALFRWISGANRLKPPRKDSDETMRAFANHPYVEQYIRWQEAEEAGMVEADDDEGSEPTAGEYGTGKEPPNPKDTPSHTASAGRSPNDVNYDRGSFGGAKKSISPKGPQGPRATVEFPSELHRALHDYDTRRIERGKNPKPEQERRNARRFEALSQWLGISSKGDMLKKAIEYRDMVKAMVDEDFEEGAVLRAPDHEVDSENIPFSRAGKSVQYERGRHGYVMAMFDDGMFRQLQAFIREEDLAEDGVENEPHVTVLYGITGDSIPEADHIGPFVMELDGLDYFEKDDCDVVYAKVYGQAVVSMHQLFKDATENEQSHPDYTPHATLAYVKKGMGAYYAAAFNMPKTMIKVDSLTYSDKDGRRRIMPLNGPTQYQKD